MKNFLLYSVLFATSTAFAVEPYLGYLYPAGMKKGSKTQVIVGGQALWGNVKPLLSDPGIKVLSVTSVPNFPNTVETQRRYLKKYLENIEAGKTNAPPLPEENKREGWRNNPWWEKMDTLDPLALSLLAKDLYVRRNALQATPSIQQLLIVELEIPDSVETGEYSIRFFSGNGVSNSKRFFVDDASHTQEPLFSPPFTAKKETAAVDTFPAVLDGQIMPGETDRFVFRLSAGQPYTFSLCGRELQPFIGDAVPGHFQAVLRLVDASGEETAFADDDYNQIDPVLRFTPQNDGDYTLEIRDNLFRGRADFVYRVVVTPGSKPYTPRQSLIPLPEATRRMTEDDARTQILDAKTSVDIFGVISEKGKTAKFQVQAVKEQEIVFDVFARRLDSPLDSRLCLRGPDGTVVAENDDAEVELNIGPFVHNADSYLRVKIPADGIYSIELSDRIHGGDENYQYRLQIRPPTPDCTVYSAKSTLNIPEAGTSLTFYVARTDGFDGAVTLRCDDWPIGETNAIPAKQNSVTILFNYPQKRDYMPRAIHPVAEFNVNGRVITKAVVPADEIMQAFAYQHLLPADNLYALGIRPKQKPKQQPKK